MRISDWSSDVCSSDLQVDLRLKEAAKLGFTRAWIAPRRQHASGKTGKAPDKTAGKAAPGGESHAVEEIPHLLDLVARLAGHGRSEEHTSELQPLMRISYAVFCLKKKKK